MTGAFFQDLISTIAKQGRKLVRSAPKAPVSGRDILESAEAIMSERGEASGIALAQSVLEGFKGLDPEGKLDFFRALAEQFGPDHDALTTAVEDYLKHPSDARAMVLHDAAEPRRQELIRRLNRAPSGTAALVAMREELIARLPDDPALAMVDHDFDHLLSSWFNRGFLVLQRIDWNTPASILEKIIQYEAVHEIRSWDDLRRRIEPSDRRCYAFFHPALVDEPLIFVEVALSKDIPGAIAPILSDHRTPISEADATTAVFYSISNCQTGLHGVSFGNFLIKQVVEELARDITGLKRFVTLSPVPGFMSWLAKLLTGDGNDLLNDQDRDVLKWLDRTDWVSDAENAAALKDVVMPLAAYYFLRAKRSDGVPVDPVARFHLGNGARLERIHWLGDDSSIGLHQAAGLMVNYLYDLDHIERNHEIYANQGDVVASKEVQRMLKHNPHLSKKSA